MAWLFSSLRMVVAFLTELLLQGKMRTMMITCEMQQHALQ